MKKFISHHSDEILGVLSGFDRIRFRGTFRQLAYADGLMVVLNCLRVLLKNFGKFVEDTTDRLRAGVEAMASRADRPVKFLYSPQTNKEVLVQKILREQGVGPRGLVAVFSTTEVCQSYEIRRDREQKKIFLQSALRKCLHYYVYLQDPMFGLVNVRLQTWFPLNTHIVINGREWLATQMNAARMKFQRADNCFTSIEDFARAQKLANRQLNTNWPAHLNRLLYRCNPALHGLLPTIEMKPYWSADQTEWATDVIFRTANDLEALYPRLIQHAIVNFQSPDIMRFLGRRTYRNGHLHPNFNKEVVSDTATRREGLRVKHRVGANSLKMYNKQGSVLRVETTINDAHDLKVFRTKEGNSKGKRKYRQLRKGVADLRRRAALSQSANKRYLDSLAAADSSTALKAFTDVLSQPVSKDGRRARALNPLGADATLLAIISRAEYLIKGFRNADIRHALLGPDPEQQDERRRRSARVCRLIALLRLHGLVKKIPKTQRYQLTAFAQKCLPAIVAVREATLQKLTAA